MIYLKQEYFEMTIEVSQQHKELLCDISLVVFDVDGVMTNGQLLLLSDGQEVKQFNILDGLGIKLLMQAGIETAIITGRSSPQVASRSRALGITYVQQGREDKSVALQSLWDCTMHSSQTTAYIGDDLPDLSPIRSCIFGAAVPNAHPTVKEHADWCSKFNGGEGAVREFCEYILQAQGKLDELQQAYW